MTVLEPVSVHNEKQVDNQKVEYLGQNECTLKTSIDTNKLLYKKYLSNYIPTIHVFF